MRTYDQTHFPLPEPYADGTPQDHADALRDHADLSMNSPLLDYAALAAAQLIEQQAAEIERLRAELDSIGGMQLIQHNGVLLRVITSALHNRLCKGRVGTPQGTTPEVLGCSRHCGFCWPLNLASTVTRPKVIEGGDAR